MHEALTSLGAIAVDEAARHEGWTQWLGELAGAGRATLLAPSAGTPPLWVGAERLAQLLALHPGATTRPALQVPAELAQRGLDRAAALRDLLRARLGGLGPVALEALAAPLGLAQVEVERALLELQGEGSILQGRFSGEAIA
jgi:ATP-dependent Lhr-like helicase